MSTDPFTAVLGNARGSGREDVWIPPPGWSDEDPRWWAELYEVGGALGIAASRFEKAFASNVGRHLKLLPLRRMEEDVFEYALELRNDAGQRVERLVKCLAPAEAVFLINTWPSELYECAKQTTDGQWYAEGVLS